jgi:hypothetical protein
MIRVAICMPCQDTVNAGFALDLARMCAALTASDDFDATLIQNRGTIIPQQRATLVHAAQEYEATHLLWLDSDMRFPRDTLARLLAHGQPIVAANYARRRYPILPTAEHADFGYLFTEANSEGLAEVTQCAMGLMLVEMRVFEAIAEPWFALGYSAKDRDYVGEDFYFCKRAREAGFTILIDQDLSKQVRHAGEIEWTPQHTCTTRDTLKPRPLILEA